MATLTLKVKVAVRDHWDSPESTVQASLAKLQSIIGYEVCISPEWPLLLAALGDHYSDKGNFVPAVAGVVKAWSEAAAQLLEDDNNEEWTEEVLDKLKESGSRLRLVLEASKSEDASTTWNPVQEAFVISLPNTQVTNPLSYISPFQAHLLTAFDEKKAAPTVPVLHDSGHSDIPGGPGDDWASIVVEPVVKTSINPTPSSQRRAPNVEYIPDINSVPRPDELLLRPPYHLIVFARSLNEIEIQCSHSPTLKFLSAYLAKWCRTNHQLHNKPPSVESNLHQSAYGLGTWHDRLTLYAENRYSGGHCITPPIILSLVESLLGYELTYQESSRWVYRKDTPFKNL
ncbi:hypothetical protein SAPIO_CDS4458 [Scedosporium apiospermum]|uniref:Uncharacterized protein n=1 Tax=Pseudallescheria apiosperma TaxID=563466 RepID=A0A084G883_PSEDA|nr:uncharacterized protein SAPIO_CDS4458 [Scedosporium apiospermum]KEZ43545.1 hypothetical protein SAPIO_CDS4458 [Scedosporium apiospermum]